MLPVNQLLPKIAVLAAFALSCFLLLVFLWTTFGGPVPLRAQGYRVQVDFDEATALGVQAEVRISGVPVGRVISLKAAPGGLTTATIQLGARYAPLPQDAHATLRSKSIVGETYVELSPGSPDVEPIPDGGRIRTANVEPSVQLDELVRAFGPKTRAAFRTWQQQVAIASAGRGREMSETIAQFASLEEQATSLLSTLNRNSASLSRLVRNTGVVFDALSERDGQLRSLIQSSNRVFATTAARNRQFADTFVAFPAFQRESRTTLDRLVRFAETTDPLVEQLRPVAREFGPTFRATEGLAPEFEELFVALGPLQEAARDGVPATERVLAGLGDFTSALPPWLAQVTPILGYLGAYSTDITSFFSNVTAVTGAGTILGSGKAQTRYLRGLPMLAPEQMAGYPTRLSSSRPDPYATPGTTVSTTKQRPSVDTRQCTGALWPLVVDGPGVSAATTQFLRDNVFGNRTPIGPPCIQRGPRGGTQFPHLQADPTPTIP